MESIIETHLNFLKKNPYFIPLGDDTEIKKNSSEFYSIFKSISKRLDKFCIVSENEILSDTVLDIINNEIEKLPNKEIYISHSSSEFSKNHLHPLVSFVFWRNTKMRETISWDDSNSFLLFDKDLYDGEYQKTIKGILSVRKETNLRRKVFSKINFNEFDGILRYASWVSNPKDEVDNVNVDRYPSFKVLLDEFKSSYINFVFETEKDSTKNSLTEKTMISFLTKTIPIFYNNKNYCKELEDMGFYTFNNLFDFDTFTDTFDMYDNRKVDKIVKSINKFNSMSLLDIENLYKNNIEKINHNYNLCYRFLIGEDIEVKQFYPSNKIL